MREHLDYIQLLYKYKLNNICVGDSCRQSSEENSRAVGDLESKKQLAVVATTKLPETTYRPPGCKTKENHSLRNSTEQSRNEGMKRWRGYGKEKRETMER